MPCTPASLAGRAKQCELEAKTMFPAGWNTVKPYLRVARTLHERIGYIVYVCSYFHRRSLTGRYGCPFPPDVETSGGANGGAVSHFNIFRSSTKMAYMTGT